MVGAAPPALPFVTIPAREVTGLEARGGSHAVSLSRPPSTRIASLDVLRGVGVLGMLATHIQSFYSVSAARANPTVLGDLQGVAWPIWLGTYVLADGKFLTVFGVLFGASWAMLADRAEAAGEAAARLHYRRMAILFSLGVLQAYLLWYGDMLVSMAVCGALAFLYRGLAPVRQLTVGLVIFGIGAVLWATLSSPWLSGADAFSKAAAEWAPSAHAIAWETSRYRGGWLEQMDHRVPAAFTATTSALATRGLWQLTGLMLVGSALFRLGVLSGTRSRRFYAAMAATGFGLGVPLILYGVHDSFAHGWDLREFRLVGAQVNLWGGACVAAGWIGLVLLLSRVWALAPLGAVGRMALTNYLAQTLICTTLFYGHGFGLFGRVDRVGQLTIVLGVWALQLVLSVWWLKAFALGPMEWLWRYLTYGSPVRMRHP
jgi:uncharacterized protein